MITEQKREKLKLILGALSTEEEKRELSYLEMVEKNNQRFSALLEVMNESDDKIMSALANQEARFGEKLTELAKVVQKSSSAQVETQKSFYTQLTELVGNVISKIEDTKNHLTPKKTDFGPTLQNIIKGLAGVEKAVTDKPVPVWKWPQYLYSGLRDTQFKPINPAIAAFGITDPYDYVSLGYTGSNITTVVYKTGGASGNTVATLTLTYSGSNITSITRS